MSNEPNPKTDFHAPMLYQIRLKGHLDREWAGWFEGLTVTREENGETLLTGALVDQAALHGLLRKVRDLGLPLVSVNHLEPVPVETTIGNETFPNHSKKETKMNTARKTAGMKDQKVILSTLWIFAMFNYLYADVYSLFFNPVLQKELMEKLAAGYAGSIPITQGFVLITAVLMETAIVMVLLSRVLPYRANRWANILSGAFHTLFVAWSLLGETPSLFYVFFATIEIACTLFIVRYAWKWVDAEGSPAAAGIFQRRNKR